ncbi:polysaccharide lyase family 8 super-sandwich domain-containing protein [Siphonobacter aquaeclarae]|uniref:Chondroitin AC lyase n=1 Tax=Siphonobacter aquaeclarae TaxID=563176 RepID=A0A1G9R603_9BACT|nr:polysaccharide lyase family 8 super-sandwich domain-containing protein [Siphonobacter aquaeclarae]SDM18742.1 chondroitin AC lyase [Siphonobacter aquaeclarae]
MKNLFLLCCLLIAIPAFPQATGEFKTVMDRIFNGVQAGTNVTSLDASATSLLASVQADGHWTDVDYTNANNGSGWLPGTHFSRMITLAKAFSNTGSTYYGDSTVRQTVVNTMNYWLGLSSKPTSTNWFYYGITLPKDIGNALICMRYGPIAGVPSSVETQMITWMTKGYTYNSSPGSDNSNLTDIAQHYIMRACLTENGTLLAEASSKVASYLSVQSGEGIQADNSFAAHGQQLYVYGYGREFISGVTNIGAYVLGTSYAFTSAQIAAFSNYARKGFIKVSRGRYSDFNVFGRSITRPNSGGADAGMVDKSKGIDLSGYAAEYDAAAARFRGTQPASYQVSPEHLHYWRTDYTVHHRPGYMFGLRAVSTRTAKSESGNGENLKGYYLTEGVNYIATNGDEYFGIYPVWDWNKLPGITVPEITTYPVRSSWGVNPGTQSFVGGVTDGIYGVSAYQMNDYSTQARKGWFFFDDEVVCLGAGITSTASQAINTTLNQCLLSGDVTVSDGTTTSTLASGDRTSSLKWAWHNQVGYYFPDVTSVRLSNQTQTGSWAGINSGYSSDAVSKDVFKLWINHGTAPSNASYAYVVLPGKSATDMGTWTSTHLSILSNTSTVQVVRNSTLNMWQVIFYAAGSFTAEGMTVKVDKPCTLVLKNVGGSELTVFAADPNQSALKLKVGIQSALLPTMKELSLTLPTGLLAGSSISGVINSSSPDYTEPPADAPVTLEAVADAYVRDGASYQNVNYPTGTLTIKNDGVGYKREVYMKFDLSGVPAEIDSAILKIRVNNANTTVTSTRWEFYDVADNSWTETGITWANRPLPGGKIGEVQGAIAGSYVTLRITNAVRARLVKDKLLTLRISSTVVGSTTDAQFTSRESTSAVQRPQITVYPKLASSWVELTRLNPVADAYVQGGTNASTNYGAQTVLTIKKDGSESTTREVYLKFDLASVPTTQKKTLLQLYVPYAGSAVPSTTWEFYEATDNTWTETGLTWANKPAVSLKLGEILGTPSGNYVTLDISEWVRTKLGAAGGRTAAENFVTFKVISTLTNSSADAQFSARENGNTAFRPQLIVSGTESTLPVSLVSWTARRIDDASVELRWTTASEKNNAHFRLERSTDARSFEQAAIIDGNGTSTERLNYRFVDSPGSGIVYYRLQQVDYDGARTSYAVLSVAGTEPEVTVGPNPTSGRVRLDLKREPVGAVTVGVYHIGGQTIQTQTGQKSVFDFDLGTQPKGVYLLRVSGMEKAFRVVVE